MAEEIAPDVVLDEETLYRRVANKPGFFSCIDGKTRFSSTAFNDPHFRPSVDRANLRTNPSETKAAPTDGVTFLVAGPVRGISSIANLGAGNATPPFYAVDVVPRPVLAGNDQGQPENMAHAQIEANPMFTVPSRFKKLKEALALLATQNGWLIVPSDG